VIFQIRESDQLRDINLVGAAGIGVRDVGQLFQFGRNIGQFTILFRRECWFAIDTN
jgi:hypothetical protein